MPGSSFPAGIPSGRRWLTSQCPGLGSWENRPPHLKDLEREASATCQTASQKSNSATALGHGLTPRGCRISPHTWLSSGGRRFPSDRCFSSGRCWFSPGGRSFPGRQGRPLPSPGGCRLPQLPPWRGGVAGEARAQVPVAANHGTLTASWGAVIPGNATRRFITTWANSM